MYTVEQLGSSWRELLPEEIVTRQDYYFHVSLRQLYGRVHELSDGKGIGVIAQEAIKFVGSPDVWKLVTQRKLEKPLSDDELKKMKINRICIISDAFVKKNIPKATNEDFVRFRASFLEEAGISDME